VNASACIAAMRQVRRSVEELARLPHKLAVVAAPLISAELRDQFRAGVDPYGVPWAPLKPSTLKRHGPPPLTATRALRDGTKAYAGRGGIMMVLGRSYGAFAQTGFRVGHARNVKVPARRILPNRGLPASWRRILDRTALWLARKAVHQ
jgi:hypothetical protein